MRDTKRICHCDQKDNAIAHRGNANSGNGCNGPQTLEITIEKTTVLLAVMGVLVDIAVLHHHQQVGEGTEAQLSLVVSIVLK